MSFHLYTQLQYQAELRPDSPAIAYRDIRFTYRDLCLQIKKFAHAVISSGLPMQSRIGVFLPKQPETVIAMFGAMAAGACIVPINPALKSQQVKHILNDCAVSILITSPTRLQHLSGIIHQCSALKKIVITDNSIPEQEYSLPITSWNSFYSDQETELAQPEDKDIAAIFYTSGSHGKPKGVVLSHSNLAIGAESVAQYLRLSEQDRILAVLPLSFDYGFSQLTSAFLKGASVILLDYLFPKDVIHAVDKYRITGLAGIPTLWHQLADIAWPEHIKQHLRYITNSGALFSEKLIRHYRHLLPSTDIYLMYGLTEAFRSTYLEPDQIDKRPRSIGKAIPNAEIVIINEHNKECQPEETGELVHAGPLVAQGYWNNAEDTKRRFRPLPPSVSSKYGHSQAAVWSGDLVKKDSEGYMYFISRRDDMIKTSGYRVSPEEIEQSILEIDCVQECAVFSVPHEELGQSIVAIVTGKDKHSLTAGKLSARLKQTLPGYMVPRKFIITDDLPVGVNGKVDKNMLHAEFESAFSDTE
jgi:acyl-CoA ligase (AMP-forming) (exosortase A-associated)